MKIWLFLGAVLFVLTAASCRDSSPASHVLLGNMSFGRGQYQKAILQYLDADESILAGRSVVFYNLGNVYYALGEGEAALRSWAMAEKSTEEIDTLFRIAFNRGVLYYHWGRYDEAYRSFRRALILKPSDIDAKINLEDSLSRTRVALPKDLPSDEASPDGDEDSQQVLDYIRRKEAEAWSVEETPNTAYAEDW